MPEVSKSASPLSPSSRLSPLIAPFESAWRAGQQPDLADFLPSPGSETPNVLLELVGVDLAFRLQAGQPSRVEDYLQRFPRLAADADAVLSLLAHEYRVRRQSEPELSGEEYVRRFPQHRTALAARLPTGVLSPPAAQERLGGEIAPADDAEPAWPPSSRAVDTVPPRMLDAPEDWPAVAGWPVVPGYQILEELGRGGMGVVYKARQLSLKRTVALKMILSGVHADSEERARFCREAEAVAQLQHPNIVQIYEIGEYNGLPYFSLEFLDGGTLSEKTAGEPLADAEAARLVEVLARAMDHAHQRGIVHRDLKPANVLLSVSDASQKRSGEERFCEASLTECVPKITDFGLAKQLEVGSGPTRPGAILGTPCYMAPEQAAGRSHAIGPLTDVYALGAMLYELLTGCPPFRGPDVGAILEQVRVGALVPPSRIAPSPISRDLETICLKAMALEPAHRYASALALANDLARFRANEPVLARRLGPLGRTVRRLRRYPRTAAAIALALVAILGAAGMVSSERIWRRTSDLDNQILTALEQTDGSPEQVARVEALIDNLERLDPAKAASERARLAQGLARVALGRLDKQFLTEEDQDRVRTVAKLLDGRNPDLAREVRSRLAERLHRWQPVFQLSDPFSRLADVFPAGKVRVAEKALRAPPGRTSDLVLTSLPCRGNVEIRAAFRLPVGQETGPFGLALNAAEGGGYLFLLCPPARATGDGREKKRRLVRSLLAPRPSLLRQGWRLQILRKGVLVRDQELPASRELPGPLELLGQRQGERLLCRLSWSKNYKQLEYLDPFPLPSGQGAGPHRRSTQAREGTGVFGVVWPAGVGLEFLEASRQSVATPPSPLEQGDALYEVGKFTEARACYGRVASAHEGERGQGGGSEVGQAARYKEGLCLLRLEREREAVELFQQVAQLRGDRWPVLADCQLWLIFTAHKPGGGPGEVEAVRERIKARGLTFEKFAALIPDELRMRILHPRAFPPCVDAFLTPRDRLVREARRSVAGWLQLEKGMWQSRSHRQQAQVYLVQAYSLAGREGEALSTARAVLRDFSATAGDARPHSQAVAEDGPNSPLRALEQAAWILRRRGDKHAALAELDRYRLPSPVAEAPCGLTLLPERARILAALGRRREAEAELDRVLSASVAPPWLVIDACLIKGYLREEAGDRDGALAAWMRGTAAYASAGAGIQARFTPALHYAIMASRLGSATGVDLRLLLRRMAARFAGDGPEQGLGQMALSLAPPHALLSMWRTRRGRAWERKIVFRDLSLSDYYLVPLFLLGAETLHQKALPHNLSQDQDDMTWGLVRRTHAAYVAGKLRQEHIVLMVALWKTRSTLLWPGLKAKLEPGLRGPLAYLLGCRRARDNKPTEAASLFGDALSAAAPGSPLQRLAQAELDSLRKR
jgi:serine/threonine protein kinase